MCGDFPENWHKGSSEDLSTNNIQFLDVSLDCNVSWNKHIDTITQKASGYVPSLPEIKNLYSFKPLKRKHNCLIYSNFI